RRLGHEAEAAPDAQNALIAARRLRPDIALIDLSLPGGMDGLELAGRLKAEHPQTRLIALTGSALEDDRRKTLEAGFEMHLGNREILFDADGREAAAGTLLGEFRRPSWLKSV